MLATANSKCWRRPQLETPTFDIGLWPAEMLAPAQCQISCPWLMVGLSTSVGPPPAGARGQLNLIFDKWIILSHVLLGFVRHIYKISKKYSLLGMGDLNKYIFGTCTFTKIFSISRG